MNGEKVRVMFPDGIREITPKYWVIEDDFLSPAQGIGASTHKPVFDMPGYEFKEVISGDYEWIAVEVPT